MSDQVKACVFRRSEVRHRAIADYLIAQHYEATQKQFLQEASLDATADTASANLLEKKWVSVLRLQRKVSPFLYLKQEKKDAC